MVFLAACVLFALRRIDVFSNAQFWAEDGRFWFSQAYAYGWKSLLMPMTGYFQTLPRLTMQIASLFPLEYVPLFSNIVALFFRGICVAFLFTTRFNFISISERVFIALYLVIMPGLSEVHCNITNTHWYLALYGLMIIVAKRPATIQWKMHDFFFLFLSGISGPFVLFLLPCFCVKFLFSENKKAFVFVNKEHAIPLVVCFGIQAITLLLKEGARSSAPLGASVHTFVQIFSSRILAGFAYDNPPVIWGLPPVILYLFTGLFVVWAGWIVWKGGWREKVVLSFFLLLLVAALAKPMVDLVEPQWPHLQTRGKRYFVPLNICFWALLVTSIRLPQKAKIGIFSVLIAFILVENPFRLPPLPDTHYKAQVERFEECPVGKQFSFDILPVGWTMELTKK